MWAPAMHALAAHPTNKCPSLHTCTRTLQESSRFVFVPGPADPGLGSILPQPSLPSYFTSELQQALPNAVFTSNPAR